MLVSYCHLQYNSKAYVIYCHLPWNLKAHVSYCHLPYNTRARVSYIIMYCHLPSTLKAHMSYCDPPFNPKHYYLFYFFRFDIANPTRRFVLRSVTLQTGTVSILIYFAALILSVSIANIEDRMNLYDKYPNLWTDPDVCIFKQLNEKQNRKSRHTVQNPITKS